MKGLVIIYREGRGVGWLKEFLGDSTWFSGAGISRRQQSIKEELWKIDRQVIANGENHKNIKEPYGVGGGENQVSFVATQPKPSNHALSPHDCSPLAKGKVKASALSLDTFIT